MKEKSILINKSSERWPFILETLSCKAAFESFRKTTNDHMLVDEVLFSCLWKGFEKKHIYLLTLLSIVGFEYGKS